MPAGAEMDGSATWLEWSFGVYEPDAGWTAIPGLYVFAAPASGGLLRPQWRAVYVGQTTSFASRLPTHENWPAAVAWGATHIHARREDDQTMREAIERRLIRELQPPLNVEHR